MITSVSLLTKSRRVHESNIFNKNLFFAKQLSCKTIVCFSVMYNYRYKQHRGSITSHLIKLLLLISGIETNPGPAKYPCGHCKKPVRYGRSIACDHCNQWFHKKCIDMNSIIYDCYAENSKLEWECYSCALINISFSVFEHSLDNNSLQRPLTCSSPKTVYRKAKQLRIMTINFQSILGKKEELQLALVENNIDIVIGSETHLDPSINDSEFLPTSYSSFRKDREDGWGGVIVIVKNDLIVERIISSFSSEIVAVKINTLQQQPIIIGACYRPPKNSMEEINFLTSDIKTLISKYKNSPFWIVGDFNLPDIDWETKSITKYLYNKDINELFLETLKNP